MNFKKVNDLINQQARVMAELRAVRVRGIRMIVAKGNVVALGERFMSNYDRMEKMIRAVNYAHEEFDDLLDVIEALLDSEIPE